MPGTTQTPANTPTPARPGSRVTRREGGARISEWALVLAFLSLIALVPIVQTCVELARGDRVQFTDVFRSRPTARHFRQYEQTLEEKSVFQQCLRGVVRQALFATLRETGAKAILGRDHWLFYRPDIRYLVEPDRLDPGKPGSKWLQPGDPATGRESVVRAIVRFRDQLKERGIELLVIPLPGKPSIYPDKVTRRAAGHDGAKLESPTLELLKALRVRGVDSVDLFSAFSRERKGAMGQAEKEDFFLATDTHWTPAGARLAAEEVARRLREMAIPAAPPREFNIRRVLVKRRGDILEMMQTPGAENTFALETVECEQVSDPVFGPLVPSPSDRPGTYRYPGGNAPVLVLGDSFCRIYQYAEPQSLGNLEPGARSDVKNDTGTKRFLPGSAGFVSHLARAFQAPVDCIFSDGGAATDARRRLSTNPEILEGKKIVIWTFVERDVALGSSGWEDVPLPKELN